MNLSHFQLVEFLRLLDQVRREAVCPDGEHSTGLYCRERDENGNFYGRRFLAINIETKEVACVCPHCS